MSSNVKQCQAMSSRINSSKPRLFYIGMICTEAYANKIQNDAFVGAGSGKMASVVSALRLAGKRAVLISLPFIGKGPQQQPGLLCRGDGIPALFLPVWRSPSVRKVLGAFALAWFAASRVRSRDTILFYNHALEYILALLILRVRGVSVFQDIEDVPISTEKGLRGFVNRLGFELMFKLSTSRKVTVSDQVGKTLKLHDYLAIQGIATETVTADLTNKWIQLETGGPLRVHFGGSLMASTGLDLFCAAVVLLSAATKSLGRRIEFIVTGVGDMNRIRDLSSELECDCLHIELHQGVERSFYFELLDSCHASLSLRCPKSEISHTTFPSKVIEITSHGIALVSTRVSDVGDIFTNDSAWLLPEFSDQSLADVISEMALNPTEVRRRAESGQALARIRFAPLAVGRALAEFLENGSKSS